MVLEENVEDKMATEVTKEEVLECIGEKRMLINIILRRKANEIGHSLRRNCLLHDAIEEHKTEVEAVER